MCAPYALGDEFADQGSPIGRLAAYELPDLPWHDWDEWSKFLTGLRCLALFASTLKTTAPGISMTKGRL